MTFCCVVSISEDVGSTLLDFLNYLALDDILCQRFKFANSRSHLAISRNLVQQLHEIAYRTIHHIAYTSDLSSLNLSGNF